MAIIKEDFVSFAVSKLLKEKGFDIPCNCYGAYNGVNLTYRYCITDKYTNWNKHTDERIISCPTLQMAMKWLREVHNIHISVYVFNRELPITNVPIFYTCDIATKKLSSQQGHLRGIWNTYEQACEAAIRYCLENLI